MKRGFVRDDEWVAACLYADSSAFSADAFYLEAFALPRFIASDHLYFDYGFRIGDRWEEVSSEVVAAVRESLPRLMRLASLDGLVQATKDWKRNIRHAEVRLCIAVLQTDGRTFEDVRRHLEGLAPEIPWQRSVLAACTSLVQEIERGGFEGGLDALRERSREVERLLK